MVFKIIEDNEGVKFVKRRDGSNEMVLYGKRGGAYINNKNNKKIYLSSKTPSTSSNNINSQEKRFRTRYLNFKKCEKQNIQCMLKTLGLDGSEYESILHVRCDSVCDLKKNDVPLALVTDPKSKKAIGIQSTRGIVPIEPVDAPSNKAIVPAVSSTLLTTIQNVKQPLNKTKSTSVMKDIPNTSMITLKQMPSDSPTSLFAAIRRGKLLKKTSAPYPPPPLKFTSHFITLLTQVRHNMKPDDNNMNDEYDWKE
jgi:hypothetical protein